MNAAELFSSFGATSFKLPGQLDASTPSDFARGFHDFFSCTEAKDAISVVYVWVTRNPIPRLRDSSDVVYIGNTTQSLQQRHARFAEVESGAGNWERYEHIMKTFGPITVNFIRSDDPREAEKRLLDLYFDAHLEMPPLNRAH